MISSANLLLTGLPRSGSASVSALIDSLPNAVCLNTPPWQVAFARNSLDILPFCKWLIGDYTWARQQIIDGVPLADIRADDGRPLLDGMHDKLKDAANDLKPVSFKRSSLPHDFILAMRQTTLFTSVLPVLASFKYFTIIAVIRHPVDVCLSWYGLQPPLLAQGNPPGIARYWPEAIEALQNGSLPEQFATLYELYLQRYHQAGASVLRYEDVMADPMVVSRLLGQTVLPAAASRLQVNSLPHDPQKAAALRKAFKSMGVYSKLYYDL